MIKVIITLGVVILTYPVFQHHSSKSADIQTSRSCISAPKVDSGIFFCFCFNNRNLLHVFQVWFFANYLQILGHSNNYKKPKQYLFGAIGSMTMFTFYPFLLNWLAASYLVTGLFSGKAVNISS